jgi:uncharacterized membrane protein
MGESQFAPQPTAIYGVVLLLSAIAFLILMNTILRVEGPDSLLARAVGHDMKGKLSPILYVIAIAAAFVKPAIAGAIYVLVALIWVIPDRRIERVLANGQTPAPQGSTKPQ